MLVDPKGGLVQLVETLIFAFDGRLLLLALQNLVSLSLFRVLTEILDELEVVGDKLSLRVLALITELTVSHVFSSCPSTERSHLNLLVDTLE